MLLLLLRWGRKREVRGVLEAWLAEEMWGLDCGWDRIRVRRGL